MAEQIDSANTFIKALDEVELLLSEAEQAAPDKPSANELKVAVMNKSALLLLTGKFEAFLEGAAEDFVYALNALQAKGRFVPARILAEHSLHALRDAEQRLRNGQVEELRTLFTHLGRRWTDIEPCADIVIPCKFNYGKHGDGEITRLFKRVGFDDIFATVVVSDSSEVYEDIAAQTLDIKGTVNSLTNIRNNILHQDATPELTTTSLRKRSVELQQFAVALTAALQAVVDGVEQSVISEGVENAS